MPFLQGFKMKYRSRNLILADTTIPPHHHQPPTQ
jgi:hypothetical protein